MINKDRQHFNTGAGGLFFREFDGFLLEFTY